MEEIKTLQQAILYFSNEKVCVEFTSRLKWLEGKPCCPKCGSDNCVGIKTRPIFQCREKGCRKQFSVKVGTPFQDSPLSLSKLLTVLWLICNAKNGILHARLQGQLESIKAVHGTYSIVAGRSCVLVLSRNSVVRLKRTRHI
jgi:transposase-like protein